VKWGKCRARANTISPGIIITPLAKDELAGPRGEGYRRMIELCPTGRAGMPDEIGTLGALSSPEAISSRMAALRPPIGMATWHPSSRPAHHVVLAV
jgi:NAD(P)-dependent dehydrogenase (short-subunit alcohol dehydrogenase family)